MHNGALLQNDGANLAHLELVKCSDYNTVILTILHFWLKIATNPYPWQLPVLATPIFFRLMSFAVSDGSCYWALWAMPHPPPINKLKEKTIRLMLNSEKNVNCHIPACFNRHSGARDSISSHFLDLSLVRTHLKNDVTFQAN